MKGYSAGSKAAEYVLLVTTGYVCAYGLLSLFIPDGIVKANAFPMLACAAGVLFFPCFFQKAAKAAGIIAAAAAAVFIAYRVFAGGLLRVPAAGERLLGDVLAWLTGSVPVLLCVSSAAASLLAFFCGKSRLAVTVLWAANAAAGVILSLAGYKADLPVLLVITGCCGVLFARGDLRVAFAGASDGRRASDGHRASLRVTAAAAVVLAGSLAFTQLGFTGLRAAFGSAPKIDVGEVVLHVRNTLYPTTGFGDYHPDQLLGRPLTLDHTPVLEVQADGPVYLRGRIYDTYTGRSWRAAEPTGVDDAYHRSLSLSPAGYIDTGRGASGKDDPAALYMRSFRNYLNSLLESHTVTVTTKTQGQKYLFLPGTAIGDSTAGIGGQADLRRTYPDLETVKPLPGGTVYSFTYWQPDVESVDFQSALAKDLEMHREENLSLQEQSVSREMHAAYGSAKGLTARTTALAQSITKGCADEFQKAAAIERWLGEHCTYTLDPPQPGSGRDFVDTFLFVSHKGYCEHFATAMTMLLRASGVPARYVEGYASLDASESGPAEVTNAQAHAWVEYYSPLYGFITADPTPASVLLGTQTPEQENVSSSSETSSAVSKAASFSSVSSSPASSSVSSSGPRRAPPASPSGAASGKGAGPGVLGYLAAVGVAAALLLCLYAGKAAYRALWFAAVRRQSDRKMIASLYGRFAAVLTRLGFELPVSGTPQDLADLVRGRLPFGAVSFDRVTQLYQEVRFGERALTAGERKELFAFHRALPAVCRRKLGRLRYLLLFPLLH